MNEKTYQADGFCGNCGKYADAQIPKGMKLDDYFQTEHTCPHCGCDTLRRATNL